MPKLTPKISDHLEELQRNVYLAESLISVIVRCGDDPKRTALIINTAEAIEEILADVGRGLDSVELEKVSA